MQFDEWTAPTGHNVLLHCKFLSHIQQTVFIPPGTQQAPPHNCIASIWAGSHRAHDITSSASCNLEGLEIRVTTAESVQTAFSR